MPRVRLIHCLTRHTGRTFVKLVHTLNMPLYHYHMNRAITASAVGNDVAHTRTLEDVDGCGRGVLPAARPSDSVGPERACRWGICLMAEPAAATPSCLLYGWSIQLRADPHTPPPAPRLRHTHCTHHNILWKPPLRHTCHSAYTSFGWGRVGGHATVAAVALPHVAKWWHSVMFMIWSCG